MTAGCRVPGAEGAQAGLSWLTILRKRENYRQVFDGFDPARVAEFGSEKIERLMANAGIVRNRLKVLSAVRNARAFLAIQREFGRFDAYVWRFVEGKPKINRWRSLPEVLLKRRNPGLSSQDLIRRGFTFVGPTICYAFMQAVGMVNDHLAACFRHREISSVSHTV